MHPRLTLAISIMEALALFSYAISGLIEARKRRLDAVGAFMVALAAEASARIKPLPMNIDGALAAVLHDLGFPPPAGKFIFIIGRVAGLTAEVADGPQSVIQQQVTNGVAVRMAVLATIVGNVQS